MWSGGARMLLFSVLASASRLASASETLRCLIRSANDYMADSRLKLSSTKLQSREPYYECVSVNIWMKAEDFGSEHWLVILSSVRTTVTVHKSGDHSLKWMREREAHGVKCSTQTKDNIIGVKLWELQYDCVKAGAGQLVSVAFNTSSKTYTENYTIPDPVPQFNLSLDLSSKSVNVTVEPGASVKARWCHQKRPNLCSSNQLPIVIINSSRSQSETLRLPYLLPCVCVQVYYYTYVDALRLTKCPFQNVSLEEMGSDVWHTSEVTLEKSGVSWSSVCPPSFLKPSASLCWRHPTGLCTPTPNSTLEEVENSQYLLYNTSAVDKHPQMCLQFSLQNSHDIHCLFKPDMSTWEAHMGPGRRNLIVYLKSSIPAEFSAQLCALRREGCYSRGPVQLERMDGGAVEMQLNVPPRALAETLCVQVWQSDPVQRGKRILCLDHMHMRSGLFAVGALVFVVLVLLLGIFVSHATKRGTAGWLWIQNPVMLVCSSEQSAHVSAVCALASILQGELCAAVRLALWNQSSERPASATAGAGVADLGPLPWLYGQWDEVQKAEGKVIIIWSPEARRSFEKLREESMELEKIREGEEIRKGEAWWDKTMEDAEHSCKGKPGTTSNRTSEMAAAMYRTVALVEDGKDEPQSEPSFVTAPVLMAALARLRGMLRERGRSHGVVLVYFQGQSHNRDIPNDLRGIPRYCLPQNFRGLIQELGGMPTGTKSGRSGHRCWPSLLSKILLLCLARRLARRLKTWLS